MSNMIKLNYKDTIHLDEKDILDVSSTLYEYIGTLSKISRNVGYEDLESFLQLPNDKELIEKSQSMAAGLAGTSLKYVIVVGIGGSNLGAMAVYDALYSKFDILTSRRPKLIFSDTTNPREMEALKKVIDDFDSAKYEPTEICHHALKFDKAIFKEKLMEYIDSKINNKIRNPKSESPNNI